MRLNFSWKSNASNIRQPKLSASYKENVAAIFQSKCYFLNLEKLKKLLQFPIFLVITPPSPNHPLPIPGLENFLSPPITAIFKKSHPPLYQGERGFGLPERKPLSFILSNVRLQKHCLHFWITHRFHCKFSKCDRAANFQSISDQMSLEEVIYKIFLKYEILELTQQRQVFSNHSFSYS